MLKGKSLLDYIYLFSPNKYEINNIIDSKKVKIKKSYFIIYGKYKKFKNPKI